MPIGNAAIGKRSGSGSFGFPRWIAGPWLDGDWRPVSPHPSALFPPCLQPYERVPARFVPSNRLQRRWRPLEAVLTGRNERAGTRLEDGMVANRARTALTGAVRTDTDLAQCWASPGWVGGRSCSGASRPRPSAHRCPGRESGTPSGPWRGWRWCVQEPSPSLRHGSQPYVDC